MGRPGERASHTASLAVGARDGGPSPPSSSANAPQASGSFADDIRREDWSRAEKAIAAMPDSERHAPEIRFAYAQVLVALGKGKEALTALDGLERELPLLTSELEELRASADVLVGEYARAGEFFRSQRTVRSLFRAGEAFEKGALAGRAQLAYDEIVGHATRTRLEEARARSLRVALKLRSVAADVQDLRWIVLRAPDAPVAADVDKALLRLQSGFRPTADEELVRAKTLLEAGLMDEALLALDRAAAQGVPVDRRERCHLRGEALFRSKTHPMEAVRVLDECAALAGPQAAEEEFLAARSFSRADRDDEAIVRYVHVAQKYPKTRWADEASFLAARLHAIHGRWSLADKSLGEYRTRFPKGEFRTESLRYLAIAEFVGQRYKSARRLFEQLSADETDPLAAASARSHAALSALRDGDRTHAVAVWVELVRSRPFSWPSLLAHARLEELGADVVDPQGTPGEAPSPHLTLPAPVDLFRRLGFDDRAEVALMSRQAQLQGQASRTQLLCAAFGQLDRARYLFDVARDVPRDLLQDGPGEANRWAWRCSYPAPFHLDVAELERANALPGGLIYAVMRQESNFRPEAVSPAHAEGLMQLLPATAKAVAGKYNLALSEGALRDPHVNLKLGAYYLRDMLTELKDEIPLAVASYNAGSEPIIKWLGRQHVLELDLFVEQIPFLETRAYVQRVMGNLARYRALADAQNPLRVRLQLAGKFTSPQSL